MSRRHIHDAPFRESHILVRSHVHENSVIVYYQFYRATISTKYNGTTSCMVPNIGHDDNRGHKGDIRFLFVLFLMRPQPINPYPWDHFG